MDEKKVEIIIGKDGSIRAEAFGFKGGTCEKATEFLDTLFKVDGREHKASFYEDGETLINPISNGYCG